MTFSSDRFGTRRWAQNPKCNPLKPALCVRVREGAKISFWGVTGLQIYFLKTFSKPLGTRFIFVTPPSGKSSTGGLQGYICF
jgi:hypothetical protein